MRIILFIILLFYSINTFACDVEWVHGWCPTTKAVPSNNPIEYRDSCNGYIQYGFCFTRVTPSFTTGPGGGISEPIVDFTLVKKLPFSIFTIKF